MRGMRRHLSATYFSFDPRSLALFRILFGAVLLFDLYERYQGVDYWYTSDGLLGRPDLSYKFTLFAMVSTHDQAVFAMALCGLVFLAFVLGFKTRLAHFLALICFVSLNGRAVMLENGGNYVMALLCLWSLFLPLGKRFSVDAVLHSLRRRRESTAEQLADREAMGTGVEPVVSLAVFALLLQFSIIYLLNVLHKTGPTWIDGSAVHYTLHQDRVVTAVGVWLREHLPYPVLRYLTWGTLAVEAAAVALILSPVWTRHLRLAAVFALPLLHVGFALCLDLGAFSWVMASYFALLVGPTHWRWLGNVWRRLVPRRIAYFDDACGICFQLCRIFTRLDPLDRVRFVSNREVPLGVAAEVVERTIVVVDEESGRVTTRAAAIARLLGGLPLGLPLALFLKLPGFAQLADRLYDRVAANRVAISRWFGLAACDREPPTRREPAAAAPPSPARRWSTRWAVRLREALVVLVAVVSFGEVARANPAVPDWMRYRQPEPFDRFVRSMGLMQHWRMFSPDAPTHDLTIAVEALTAGGRLVDPYNEVASRYGEPSFETIPVRLGQGQFFGNYSLRIAFKRFGGYRPALRQWILRYHLRTGNPDDRIVSFTVHRLKDRSPRPGSRTLPLRALRSTVMEHP